MYILASIRNLDMFYVVVQTELKIVLFLAIYLI